MNNTSINVQQQFEVLYPHVETHVLIQRTLFTHLIYISFIYVYPSHICLPTSKAAEKNSVVVDRAESIQGLKDQLGKCRNLLQNRDANPNMGKDQHTTSSLTLALMNYLTCVCFHTNYLIQFTDAPIADTMTGTPAPVLKEIIHTKNKPLTTIWGAQSHQGTPRPSLNTI